MNLRNWVNENVEASRELVGSGMAGARSAWSASRPDTSVCAVTEAARDQWRAALIGACIGAVAAGLADERKRPQTAIMGTVIGGLIGLTTGMAWGARGTLRDVAGSALRSVEETRDARWLAQNPIDYA